MTVEGIDPSFLRMAILKLQEMDCDVTTTETSITVARTNPLRAADIQTLPHPGFPTDLQAQFLLLNALAEGNSVISENIFENRFMFASELIRMGADVTIDAHHALIQGVDHSKAHLSHRLIYVEGEALVIAGLAAEGETES